MGSYAHTPIPISKHRIEALADGVFAIAMTLLVLEIKIPDLPHSATSAEIWRAVAHEGPVFLSFLITFILAGAFWYLHQSVLRCLSELRGSLLALNIGFLMFVSVLPFSTALLGRHLANTFAQEVYFGNQFALGMLLALQWRVALAKKVVADPRSAEAKELPWMLARFPIGATVSMLVALKNVHWSFWAFMVGVLMVRAARRIAGKRAMKTPAA